MCVHSVCACGVCVVYVTVCVTMWLWYVCVHGVRVCDRVWLCGCV